MAAKIKVPKLAKLSDPDYTNLKNGIQALKAENDSLKQRLERLQTLPENLRTNGARVSWRRNRIAERSAGS